MQILIVSSVAFLASLLSSMSGAGSAMPTTPVWLSLGFPLPIAIASNQMNGAARTLIVARNYLKGRALDWRPIAIMAASGSPAPGPEPSSCEASMNTSCSMDRSKI